MGAITTELVETGEKRDKRGRRVTPAARRAHLVQAYRESGATMAEFARREGVNYTTLAGWVKKLPLAGGTKSPIKFAEMRMPYVAPSAAPEDQIEVRLPDGTILRGTRVADVVALVQALRA